MMSDIPMCVCADFHDGHDPECPVLREIARLTAIETALVDLVALKAYKDEHGKLPYYQARQPIVWAAARQALAIDKGDV
jgi:hypothetical protein